jgi:hypothetical protein
MLLPMEHRALLHEHFVFINTPRSSQNETFIKIFRPSIFSLPPPPIPSRLTLTTANLLSLSLSLSLEHFISNSTLLPGLAPRTHSNNEVLLLLDGGGLVVYVKSLSKTRRQHLLTIDAIHMNNDFRLLVRSITLMYIVVNEQ